eukprot:7024755-Prymnesium_polylepis.3
MTHPSTDVSAALDYSICTQMFPLVLQTVRRTCRHSSASRACSDANRRVNDAAAWLAAAWLAAAWFGGGVGWRRRGSKMPPVSTYSGM